MPQAAIPNKNTQLRTYVVAADEAWAEGAIISLANGEISEEAGADPSPFLGFAAHAVPMEPVDVYDGSAMVYVAYPGSTFWLEGSSAPVVADEGDEYGLVLSSGVAIVDKTETTNVRVRVERVDLLRNLFEVSVIGGHRQLQDEGES